MKLGRRGFLGGLLGLAGGAAVAKAGKDLIVKPEVCVHQMQRCINRHAWYCTKCGHEEDGATYGMAPAVSNWEWRTCLVSHDGQNWTPFPAKKAFEKFVREAPVYVQGPDELVAEVILRAKERQQRDSLYELDQGDRERIDANPELERDLASRIECGHIWVTGDDNRKRDSLEYIDPGKSMRRIGKDFFKVLEGEQPMVLERPKRNKFVLPKTEAVSKPPVESYPRFYPEPGQADENGSYTSNWAFTLEEQT